MSAATAAVTIRIIWIVFWSYWVYSARKTKKTAKAERPLQRSLHLLAMMTGWVLLLWGEVLPDFLHGRIIPLNFPNHIVGITVACLGLWIAFWARITLGANWSGAVTLKQDHQIVRSGPYRWVRHPIYTGIITLISGSAIVTGETRGLIALVIVVCAYLVKIPKEETLLSTYFPEEYPHYRETTRKLIPFIY